MTKELESLKRIRKELAKHYGIEKIYEWNSIEDDFDIIESALKGIKEDEHYVHIKWDTFREMQKQLKALEIISYISKHTSHFRLKERQNFGEDDISYYLVIGQGIYECEYRLKDKEEFDLLKEVLKDE